MKNNDKYNDDENINTDKDEDIEDINDEDDIDDTDDDSDDTENDDEIPVKKTAAEIPDIAVTQEMIDAEYFEPEPEKERTVVWIFEWIEIFSSALFTVILIFTFIFRLVTVQGPSMEHTLHGGEIDYPGALSKDNLIISNLFYTPTQGDIVVIQVPNTSFTTPIIKRVIATEGQTVDFDFENWTVIVDGVALDEPYVNRETGRNMAMENILLETLPITIEHGKIFVMGDNRNHSSDSRDARIGQVDVRNVVGRVLLRVYPLNKFGVVKPNES